MENRGIFQVLKRGDKYKIIYIEKGIELVEFTNDFKSYNEATSYKKDHKSELDEIVTSKKEEEKARILKEEEEKKAKEQEEVAKEKKRKRKKQKEKKKLKHF